MKHLIIKAVKHSSFKFSLWTGVGNFVELGALYVFVLLGMVRVVAYVPAFFVSVLWNFLGSYHLVFEKTGRSAHSSFWQYFLVAIGSLAVNQIFLALLEFELGLFYYGVIMTGPATFAWSYSWNKFYTFGSHEPWKHWLVAFSTLVVCGIALWVSYIYYGVENIMNLT